MSDMSLFSKDHVVDILVLTKLSVLSILNANIFSIFTAKLISIKELKMNPLSKKRGQIGCNKEKESDAKRERELVIE